MRKLNLNFKIQSFKFNNLVFVPIILFGTFLPVQNLSAATMYIDQNLTSGKVGVECVSYFPVKINSEGENTNSADIKINFDPTKVQVHDFDPLAAGIQVQNGNIYTDLPYNLVNNSTGEIKVTGYRLNSFNGDNVYFYVYVKPLQLNTQIDFNIEFTAQNETHDSNVAQSSTSLDLLTSVQNRSFFFTGNECNEGTPIPVPPTDPVPGVDEPEPPVSGPVTQEPEPTEPGTTVIPPVNHFEKSLRDLLNNIDIVIPGVIVGLSLIIPGVVIGNPLDFILYFIGSFLIRKKYWGIVFDSVTFDKLPLTTIRIYRMENGKEEYLAQTISDMEGKYGFKIGEGGKYVIEYIREGYEISRRILSVQDSSEIILDVGLKSLENYKDSFKTKLKRFFRENYGNFYRILRLISIIIMSVGTYLAFEFFYNQASFLNLAILLFYFVLLFIQIWNFIFEFAQLKRVKVLDDSNQSPIKGVIVRLKNAERPNEREDIVISNAKGIVLPKVNGKKYKFQASKPGYNIKMGDVEIRKNTVNTILMSGIGTTSSKFGEI